MTALAQKPKSDSHLKPISVAPPLVVANDVESNSVTWLGGGQRFVVCAFYTANYLERVRTLRASLQRFRINYHFQQVDGRTSWEATTRIKPDFVIDCLKRFPNHDVLYLDADAVVRSYPDFFDRVTGDVALLFSPVIKRGKRLLSIAAGTLYIRNTPGGLRFAETWRRQELKAGPLSRDEDMIYMAFDEFWGITFTALPRSYSKIFDGIGPEPVIEHFQASRKQFKAARWLRRTARVGIAAVVSLAIYGLWSLLN